MRSTLIIYSVIGVLFLEVISVCAFLYWNAGLSVGSTEMQNHLRASNVATVIQQYRKEVGTLPGPRFSASRIIADFGSLIKCHKNILVKGVWGGDFFIFYSAKKFLVVSGGPNQCLDATGGDDSHYLYTISD